MSQFKSTLILLAIALLLVIAGCERKIINEGGETADSGEDCFVCHGGDGMLLAAKGEWQNSVHASGNNVDYTNRGGTDCTKCHDHQGFLDFVETGEVNAPYDQVSSIHCFTCHAPHERGDLTLRTAVAVTLANGDSFNHGAGNICANCHQSRTDVNALAIANASTSRYWGPHHGTQADLLNGSNGYEFSGESYESTPHASVGDNEGCVRCHMGQPSTHLGYGVGGHSFNMEDEETGVTLVGVCQDCHDTDDFDHDDIQTDTENLLEELRVLLVGANVLDGTDHPTTGTIVDQNVAGALWNFLVILEDRSNGVHNPEYIIDLLETSISYMESLPSSPKILPGTIASH